MNYMKSNKNGVKLLAAVAVLAMLACSVVVVASSSDAETTTVTIEKGDNPDFEVSSWDAAIEKLAGGKTVVLNVYDNTKSEYIQNIEVSSSATIPAGSTLIIKGNPVPASDGRDKNQNAETGGANFTITIKDGVTLTVAGTVYNNMGSKATTSNIINNGTIEFIGAGKFLSTSDFQTHNSGISGAFYTSVKTDYTSYKTIYSADVSYLVDKVNANAYNNDYVSPIESKEHKNVKAIFTYGNVTIGQNVDLITDSIILAIGGVGQGDATITLVADKTLNADIVNARDGSKATVNVKAGTNGITFSNGSIIISGTIVENGPSAITVTGGVAKLVGDIPANMTVTINDGATLEIPEGASITNNGTITNNGIFNVGGTLTNKKTVNGTNSVTIVSDEAEIIKGEGATGDISPKIVLDKTDKTPLSGNILAYEGDVIIEGDAYLSADLEIPAEKKFIIRSTGSLDLNGYTLTINGQVIIESGANVFGSDATPVEDNDMNTIILMRGASIQNDGVLGALKGITVKVGSTETYDGIGSVTLTNGSGVEFGLANTTATDSTKAQFTLTVTGDVYSDAAGTISISKARIIKQMTVGENVTLTLANGASESDKNEVFLMGGATLTVDGMMNIPASTSFAYFTMKYNSTVVMNGTLVGAITAETGEYITSAGYTSSCGTTTVSVTGNVIPTPTGTTNGMTGFTLTVGSFSYQKTIASVKTAVTYQALYIEGDLDYINTATTPNASVTESTLVINGNKAYIAQDATLALEKNMGISVTGNTTLLSTQTANQTVTENNTLVVLGMVSMASQPTIPTFNFVGASYVIKGATTDASVAYIEPFTSAITKIADANNKTVAVRGTLDIAESYELLEGQVLDISNADANVTIKETGSVTVQAKARVNGTFDLVEGILKVMKNGACGAPASYASLTTSTEYTQYSGLKIAIANAQPGDVVKIVSNATVSSDLEVPAGVTIESNAKISVDGNVVIAETAKVILKDNTGELEITKAKATLTVNGELDASDGKITLATDDKVYSKGKTVVANQTAFNSLSSKTNAFTYVNEENQVVLTNAQAALDAVSKMDVVRGVDVYGTVSEGDVTVSRDVTVQTGATVSFGNVTINDGYKVDMTYGTTTGTFSVETGVPETTGATTTSTLNLNKVSGIIIGAGKEVDAQNVTTKLFYIYGTLAGTAAVTEGTVSIGMDSSTAGTTDKLTVNGGTNKVYLTVNAGATLDVRDRMDLVAGKNTVNSVDEAAVIVNGTLNVNKGEVLAVTTDSGASGIIDINGAFVIADSTTITYDGIMNVAGSVDISVTENKTGLLNAGGNVFVKDGASVSGAIEVPTTKYLLAYAGADLTNAKINVNAAGESDAFATAFYINSDVYMTVYTEGTDIDAKSVIDAAEFSVDGYDLTDVKKVTETGGHTTYWYKDNTYEAALIDSDNLMKSVPALYFKADKAEVTGTISTGVGLQIYLNGVSVDNYLATGGYSVPVGTYKVTIEAQNGYDKSTAVISFNGATVTDGGSITFTENGFTLTANGATASNGSTSGSSSSSDDGMSITDYLLIVLVVLIVIMAVLVAIRMMRS